MSRKLCVALCAAVALAGCAGDSKVPDLPPAVNACTDMAPVRINEKAGRVMIQEGDRAELEKNAANNRHLHEKCFSPKDRAGGPR